ncbi:hypothetical protein SASPL_108066 [Salvia splendens]|uniref:Myb/SANT-like domain-containing protein n=1 Tax=Salvia splendens TaxID=180675 RepID=A0A8X9A513_SALSN|nr:hypothetical protein SASPL_108066 [Salvia splendens]
MFSRIPAQASFFYSGKWIQEMDYVLLTTLIEMRNGIGRDDAAFPNYMIRLCVKLINRRFGCELSCSDVNTRLMVLKQRYETFKVLVATHGVRWEQADKIVVANEEVWRGVLMVRIFIFNSCIGDRFFKRIMNSRFVFFKLNAFAGAYYHRDEPHFNELATIFGYNDVKVDDATEVITISDNTEIVVITDTVEPNAPVRGRMQQLDVDLDEVNSPSPGAACRVRRKLFHFDSVKLDLDHLSSSNSPSRVIPAKKLTVSSPKGSSGASCSPLPRSRKTLP